MNPPYGMSGPFLNFYADLRYTVRQPAFLARRATQPTPVDAPAIAGLVVGAGISLVLWTVIIAGISVFL